MKWELESPLGILHEVSRHFTYFAVVHQVVILKCASQTGPTFFPIPGPVTWQRWRRRRWRSFDVDAGAATSVVVVGSGSRSSARWKRETVCRVIGVICPGCDFGDRCSSSPRGGARCSSCPRARCSSSPRGRAAATAIRIYSARDTEWKPKVNSGRRHVHRARVAEK